MRALSGVVSETALPRIQIALRLKSGPCEIGMPVLALCGICWQRFPRCRSDLTGSF